MGSRPVTRTWLFWGSDGAPWSLTLYDSLGVGQRVSGQRQPRRQWDLWLALILLSPGTKGWWPQWEARLAARLSQDLILLAPQAWLGVPWGAPSHSPTALMGGETAFIFLPARLQRGFCSK